MYPVTYHGLHEWHKAMFEKFGWMILAKHHHRTLKIKAYLDSLKHLEQSIVDKINTVENQDHKADLTILLSNVKVLRRQARTLNPRK